MYKRLLLTILCSMLLLACTDEQENTSENTAEKTAELTTENLALNNEDKKDIELLTLTEDKKNKLTDLLKKHGSKQSIILNKEKFTLLSNIFAKGAKVYNIAMGESGLVKGTIVVVSIGEVIAEDIQYPNTEVIKIAKSTFRLIPDNNVVMMDFYKALINSKRFSVVEMEIDYSPIKKLAEY